MSLFSRCLIVFIAAGSALLMADEKNEKKFSPGPALSYPTRQTIQNVTIAAVPYTSDVDLRSAFGKHNPAQYGVLPVLVVIQNATDKALALRNLEVHYELPDGRNIDPTPAGDIGRLRGARHPKQVPVNVGSPLPIPTARKKGGTDWEIEGREFAVQMLPPREGASGFFYFQTTSVPGAKLYVSGIREAATGQELFYFEVPLDAK